MSMIFPLFLRFCACSTISVPHFLRIGVIFIDTVDCMKELCKERKMNQQTLADAVGIKEDTVSNWFRRKSASYSKYLPQIAEALGTTTEYLLTGTGPKQKRAVSDSDTDLLTGAEHLDLGTFHRIPILGRISAGLPSMPNSISRGIQSQTSTVRPSTSPSSSTGTA